MAGRLRSNDAAINARREADRQRILPTEEELVVVDEDRPIKVTFAQASYFAPVGVTYGFVDSINRLRALIEQDSVCWSIDEMGALQSTDNAMTLDRPEEITQANFIAAVQAVAEAERREIEAIGEGITDKDELKQLIEEAKQRIEDARQKAEAVMMAGKLTICPFKELYHHDNKSDNKSLVVNVRGADFPTYMSGFRILLYNECIVLFNRGITAIAQRKSSHSRDDTMLWEQCIDLARREFIYYMQLIGLWYFHEIKNSRISPLPYDRIKKRTYDAFLAYWLQLNVALDEQDVEETIRDEFVGLKEGKYDLLNPVAIQGYLDAIANTNVTNNVITDAISNALNSVVHSNGMYISIHKFKAKLVPQNPIIRVPYRTGLYFPRRIVDLYTAKKPVATTTIVEEKITMPLPVDYDIEKEVEVFKIQDALVHQDTFKQRDAVEKGRQALPVSVDMEQPAFFPLMNAMAIEEEDVNDIQPVNMDNEITGFAVTVHPDEVAIALEQQLENVMEQQQEEETGPTPMSIDMAATSDKEEEVSLSDNEYSLSDGLKHNLHVDALIELPPTVMSGMDATHNVMELLAYGMHKMKLALLNIDPVLHYAKERVEPMECYVYRGMTGDIIYKEFDDLKRQFSSKTSLDVITTVLKNVIITDTPTKSHFQQWWQSTKNNPGNFPFVNIHHVRRGKRRIERLWCLASNAEKKTTDDFLGAFYRYVITFPDEKSNMYSFASAAAALDYYDKKHQNDAEYRSYDDDDLVKTLASMLGQVMASASFSPMQVKWMSIKDASVWDEMAKQFPEDNPFGTVENNRGPRRKSSSSSNAMEEEKIEYISSKNNPGGRPRLRAPGYIRRKAAPPAGRRPTKVEDAIEEQEQEKSEEENAMEETDIESQQQNVAMEITPDEDERLDASEEDDDEERRKQAKAGAIRSEYRRGHNALSAQFDAVINDLKSRGEDTTEEEQKKATASEQYRVNYALNMDQPPPQEQPSFGISKLVSIAMMSPTTNEDVVSETTTIDQRMTEMEMANQIAIEEGKAMTTKERPQIMNNWRKAMGFKEEKFDIGSEGAIDLPLLHNALLERFITLFVDKHVIYSDAMNAIYTALNLSDMEDTRRTQMINFDQEFGQEIRDHWYENDGEVIPPPDFGAIEEDVMVDETTAKFKNEIDRLTADLDTFERELDQYDEQRGYRVQRAGMEQEAFDDYRQKLDASIVQAQTDMDDPEANKDYQAKIMDQLLKEKAVSYDEWRKHKMDLFEDEERNDRDALAQNFARAQSKLRKVETELEAHTNALIARRDEERRIIEEDKQRVRDEKEEERKAKKRETERARREIEKAKREESKEQAIAEKRIMQTKGRSVILTNWNDKLSLPAVPKLRGNVDTNTLHNQILDYLYGIVEEEAKSASGSNTLATDMIYRKLGLNPNTGAGREAIKNFGEEFATQLSTKIKEPTTENAIKEKEDHFVQAKHRQIAEESEDESSDEEGSQTSSSSSMPRHISIHKTRVDIHHYYRDFIACNATGIPVDQTTYAINLLTKATVMMNRIIYAISRASDAHMLHLQSPSDHRHVIDVLLTKGIELEKISTAIAQGNDEDEMFNQRIHALYRSMLHKLGAKEGDEMAYIALRNAHPLLQEMFTLNNFLAIYEDQSDLLQFMYYEWIVFPVIQRIKTLYLTVEEPMDMYLETDLLRDYSKIFLKKDFNEKYNKSEGDTTLWAKVIKERIDIHTDDYYEIASEIMTLMQRMAHIQIICSRFERIDHLSKYDAMTPKDAEFNKEINQAKLQHAMDLQKESKREQFIRILALQAWMASDRGMFRFIYDYQDHTNKFVIKVNHQIRRSKDASAVKDIAQRFNRCDAVYKEKIEELKSTMKYALIKQRKQTQKISETAKVVSPDLRNFVYAIAAVGLWRKEKQQEYAMGKSKRFLNSKRNGFSDEEVKNDLVMLSNQNDFKSDLIKAEMHLKQKIAAAQEDSDIKVHMHKAFLAHATEFRKGITAERVEELKLLAQDIKSNTFYSYVQRLLNVKNKTGYSIVKAAEVLELPSSDEASKKKRLAFGITNDFMFLPKAFSFAVVGGLRDAMTIDELLPENLRNRLYKEIVYRESLDLACDRLQQEHRDKHDQIEKFRTLDMQSDARKALLDRNHGFLMRTFIFMHTVASILKKKSNPYLIPLYFEMWYDTGNFKLFAPPQSKMWKDFMENQVKHSLNMQMT
jgi:hypothetical protein